MSVAESWARGISPSCGSWPGLSVSPSLLPEFLCRGLPEGLEAGAAVAAETGVLDIDAGVRVLILASRLEQERRHRIAQRSDAQRQQVERRLFRGRGEWQAAGMAQDVADRDRPFRLLQEQMMAVLFHGQPLVVELGKVFFDGIVERQLARKEASVPQDGWHHDRSSLLNGHEAGSFTFGEARSRIPSLREAISAHPRRDRFRRYCR